MMTACNLLRSNMNDGLQCCRPVRDEHIPRIRRATCSRPVTSGVELHHTEAIKHFPYLSMVMLQPAALGLVRSGHGCCNNYSIPTDSSGLWKTQLRLKHSWEHTTLFLSIEKNEQARPALRRDFISRDVVLLFTGRTTVRALAGLVINLCSSADQCIIVEGKSSH